MQNSIYYHCNTAEERRAVMQLLLVLGVPYADPGQQTIDAVDSYADYEAFPNLFFRDDDTFEMTSDASRTAVTLSAFLAEAAALKKSVIKRVKLNSDYTAKIVKKEGQVTITVGCQTIEHNEALALSTVLHGMFDSTDEVHCLGEQWRDTESGNIYELVVRAEHSDTGKMELGLRRIDRETTWWCSLVCGNPDFMTEAEFNQLFFEGQRKRFERVS